MRCRLNAPSGERERLGSFVMMTARPIHLPHRSKEEEDSLHWPLDGMMSVDIRLQVSSPRIYNSTKYIKSLFFFFKSVKTKKAPRLGWPHGNNLISIFKNLIDSLLTPYLFNELSYIRRRRRRIDNFLRVFKYKNEEESR